MENLRIAAKAKLTPTPHGMAYAQDYLQADTSGTWLIARQNKLNRVYSYGSLASDTSLLSYTCKDTVVTFFCTKEDDGSYAVIEEVKIKNEKAWVFANKKAYTDLVDCLKYIGNEVRYTVPAKEDYVIARPKGKK